MMLATTPEIEDMQIVSKVSPPTVVQPADVVIDSLSLEESDDSQEETQTWHNDNEIEFVPFDLWTAVNFRRGGSRLLKYVLRSNTTVDINERNVCGWTALMYACLSGNVIGVKLLLALGADQSIRSDYGQTAFMIAVISGHDDIVCLLDSNVDLEQCDNRGWTPLIYAVRVGALSTAKLLISKGANVDAVEYPSGRTILMMALNLDYASLCDMIPFLISNGINYRALTLDMRSAEDFAREMGLNDVADYIADPYAFELHNQYQLIFQVPTTLLELLERSDLGKHHGFFQTHHIDMDRFLTLSEQDLKDLGFCIVGVRKKLVKLIEDFNYGQKMGLYANQSGRRMK